MKKYGIRGYGVLIVLTAAWLVGQHGARPLSADQSGGLPVLEKRVEALEAKIQALLQTNTSQAAQITALTSRLLVVEAKTAPISVAGTSFMITGKNVFIQDGSGQTDGGTGLGNLTIGYNGLREPLGGIDIRTGTHNLILGDRQNYSSYGGLVAGITNSISGPYASVSGGQANTASGFAASVSGGQVNTASFFYASVSGGNGNEASAFASSVSGGEANTASGATASVSGGNGNTAGGGSASVGGGFGNTAGGGSASVSGGNSRSAPGGFNWAAGGLFQPN